MHLEKIATGIFALAILHTFLTKYFLSLSHRFKEKSAPAILFHLLGEVEIVFGLWAGLFFAGFAIFQGVEPAVTYLNLRNFTEPTFVFVVMAITATRPVIWAADKFIDFIAVGKGAWQAITFYWVCLVVGPILGSFVTEPAAMTVSAILLRDRYFRAKVSQSFRYLTIGLLFTNVSIGGTLTNFAAPPVLMVAAKWKWDSFYLFSRFGWKATLAIIISTSIATWFFRKDLRKVSRDPVYQGQIRSSLIQKNQIPLWIVGVHLVFLFLIVLFSHYMAVFLGLFLFFLGFTTITKQHQDEVNLRSSLLVGFFLAGLVVLGGMQGWWLEPLLRSLSEGALFLGATALTAVTDNAALTYLGSQVENLSEGMKQALVAGAVAGGGLTVIANAPNPAGYSLLSETFGEDGINPLKLLAGALIPTLIAIACLWYLPNWG